MPVQPCRPDWTDVCRRQLQLTYSTQKDGSPSKNQRRRGVKNSPLHSKIRFQSQKPTVKMLGPAQHNVESPSHVDSPLNNSPRRAPGPSGHNNSPGASPRGQGKAGQSPLAIKFQRANSQFKRPSRATNQGAPKSPFSYAAATAARSMAPFISSSECEQYRALAKKARDSPRVLSIKLQRPPAASQGPESPPDQAEWGDLIFNACGVDPKDIQGIDFEAGGQLNCEVKLAKGSDLAKYAGKTGLFKDYNFNTYGPAESEVTITFKGIALSVPDLEIIHLLKSYGYKPSESGVQHTPVPVTSSNPEVGCKAEESTTRTIKAVPPTSKRLRAYYFWAGIQESDLPRRVTVDHKGRGPRQCAHCLRGPQDPFPCSFNGKSSACKKHNSSGRTSLAQYNKLLREQDGYSSLKSLMLTSSPAAETEPEADEKDSDSEESTPHLVQPVSWAAEPRTFSPEKDREDLESQVLSLTKKLADSEKSAKEATNRSRKQRHQISQVNKEAAENRHSLSLSRDHCISRLRQLLPEEENPSWSNNTECLISMLASTTKPNNFTLSQDGVLSVKDGKSPWADLYKDISSIPEKDQAKALMRVNEVIEGAQAKIKERMQHLANNKARSVSRGRVTDSDDEVKSSKFQKSNPPSPTLKVPEKDGWPALPHPGGRVALLDTVQSSSGPRVPEVRKEPPETQEPQKVQVDLEGRVDQVEPGPQPEAPKPEGLPRSSEERKEPPRAPEPPEDQAPHGRAPKGSKKDPLQPSQPVTNWLLQNSKASNLKGPLPRPPRSSGKGDAKITPKAQQ